MEKNGTAAQLLDYLHTLGEKRCAKLVADAISTDDLWQLLRRRVPSLVNEYFRGGADDEITLVENVLAFQQARTTAAGAKKFSSLDLRTTVANHSLSVPWLVAPVGSLRTLWTNADAIASRVAGEFGTVMTLSNFAGTPMEDVKKASDGECWFQLYLCGGREVGTRSIERAKRAGYSGLVLTVDTGVSGNRAVHAKMKPTVALETLSGVSLRKQIELIQTKMKIAPQMIIHLPWLLSHWADGGMMKFVNVQMDEQGTPMSYTDIGTQLAASAVTWDDLKWIKDVWGERPLIVKGVHNAEDAKRAEDCGAAAIIWSNHGGRQEDRVPPTLHIVAEEMPKMANSQMDFMMDGGIRRGKDVLIALSYGLKAVGLGRVCIAGIGAGGYAGMRRAFEIIQSEFERSMRLVGVNTVSAIREDGEKIRRDNSIVGNTHLKKIVF